MREGVGAGGVAAIAGQHHGKLRLVVDLVAAHVSREADGFVRTDDGADIFHEEHRIFGDRRAGFGGVVAVVEAHGIDGCRSQRGEEAGASEVTAGWLEPALPRSLQTGEDGGVGGGAGVVDVTGLVGDPRDAHTCCVSLVRGIAQWRAGCDFCGHA